MRWSLAILIAAPALLFLAGCDADAGGGDASGGEGISVGSVLPPLTFRDPSSGDSQTTEAIKAEAGVKLLFVSASAGWCSVCKSEAPTLVAWHETYGAQGLRMVYTLFEDADFQPATDTFALGWCAALKLPFDCLIDEAFTDGGLGGYFDPSAAPLNMLVRADDGVVVFLSTGFDGDLIKEKIEFYLE